MASTHASDKKAHVCPPSSAIHPADRWESLLVYSFICKFTNLLHKTEGLETPMDFEEALMLKEPNNIITQILVQFIVNLKPQTRNLSTDQISTTVASVLSEYLKTSERTIFWNEELRANVDPFEGLEGGFFATSWDFKLKILRQLVELQLSHAPEIKATIDSAWGVVHNKHKKTGTSSNSIDSKGQQDLQLIPIGQDLNRKRYWIADDSPRIYTSTNPWKMTATFQTISSTREEYLSIIEDLKSSAPPQVKKGQKRSKLEVCHLKLIEDLEGRLEAIDAGLARVAKARRKIEQKRLLLAQAEIRQTRTRRRTQKPDYVYNNEIDSEDDGDPYTYQEEDRQDDEYEQDLMDFNDGPGTRRGRGAAPLGTRRSTRTSVVNTNGKREGSSDSGLWRGERRSTRLGGVDTSHDAEPPRKRARTEESVESIHSNDTADKTKIVNGIRVKASGAAALKPTEIALEQIAGKKRSKFWVYAVEPASEGQAPLGEQSVGPPPSSPHQADTKTNGQYTNGNAESSPTTNGQPNGGMDVDKSVELTHSPVHSS